MLTCYRTKTILLKEIRKIFIISFAGIILSILLAESVHADSEYIIADSNSRYLTDADVETLSLQEINYAKNEIFARHGRKFKSAELQTYFNSKSWYTGLYEPKDFDDNYSVSLLSNCERTNADFLAAKEYALDPNGYRLDAKTGIEAQNSIYDDVLREYEWAKSQNFTGIDNYEYVAGYFAEGGGTYYGEKLYYALYDFLDDGIPELLISVYHEPTEYSEEYYEIADAFGTDGTSVQRLLSGEYIHIHSINFCENGRMVCRWQTPGGSNGGYIFYQLEPNAASGKRIEEIRYEYVSGRCYRLDGSDPDSEQQIQSFEYEDIVNSYKVLEDIPFEWHELA